jgi:hypothetical protein
VNAGDPGNVKIGVAKNLTINQGCNVREFHYFAVFDFDSSYFFRMVSVMSMPLFE